MKETANRDGTYCHLPNSGKRPVCPRVPPCSPCSPLCFPLIQTEIRMGYQAHPNYELPLLSTRMIRDSFDPVLINSGLIAGVRSACRNDPELRDFACGST